MPVDQRVLLEQRASEFELVDPRRDPGRYLAMSTGYCRRTVSEQTVRDYGTAANSFGEDEQRRLGLLAHGSQVTGVDIYGYRRDRAQVVVSLQGDPPEGSGRLRQWLIEGDVWRVRSCIG